jgi:hypothetical protein
MLLPSKCSYFSNNLSTSSSEFLVDNQFLVDNHICNQSSFSSSSSTLTVSNYFSTLTVQAMTFQKDAPNVLPS